MQKPSSPRAVRSPRVRRAPAPQNQGVGSSRNKLELQPSDCHSQGNLSRSSSRRSSLARHRTISASLEELVTVATREALQSAQSTEDQSQNSPASTLTATTPGISTSQIYPKKPLERAFQSNFFNASPNASVTTDEVATMHRDLILACEVGQQLLMQNEELSRSVQDTEASKAELERKLEEEREARRDAEESRDGLLKEVDRSKRDIARLEDSVARLRDELKRAKDAEGEADTLRERLGFLDMSQQRLEQALSTTHKELKSVSGEKRNLLVTVQELYDQLSNFREINKALKDSCQKRVDGYTAAISKMQEEKLQMALQMNQMSEQLSKYKKMISDPDLATSPSGLSEQPAWLARSVQSLLSEIKREGAAYAQIQESADLEHLKLALSTSEQENRELSDLVSRQQDTIAAMEEERGQFLSRLAEYERGSFVDNVADKTASGRPRDSTALKSLRSSLCMFNEPSSVQRNDMVLQNKDDQGPQSTSLGNIPLSEEPRDFEVLVHGLNGAKSACNGSLAIVGQLRAALTEASKRLPSPLEGVKATTAMNPDMEKLQQQNTELSSVLAQQSVNLAELKWKVRDLEQERESLVARAAELEDEVKAVRLAAEQGKPIPPSQDTLLLKAEIEENVEKIKECEAKYYNLQAKNAQVERDNQRLRSSLATSEETKQKLEQQILSLKTEQAEFQRHVQQALQQDNVNLNSLSACKAALVDTKAKCEQLARESLQAKEDLVKMRDSYSVMGAQLARQASLLGDIEWKLKDANKNNQTAMERVKGLEEEKAQLEAKLNQEQNISDNIVRVTMSPEVPNNPSTSPASQPPLLERELISKEQMLAKLSREHERVKLELSKYKLQAEQLDGEVKMLSAKLPSSSNNKLVKATKSVASDEDSTIRDLESQIERLKIEKRVLNDSLTTLGSQLALLSNKKGEDDWTIKELTTAKERVLRENEDLKQELIRVREALKTSEDRLLRLQDRTEKSDKGGVVKELNEQLKEARRAQLELEGKMSMKDDEIRRTKMEVEALRAKLDSTAFEKDKIEKKITDSSLELSRIISNSLGDGRHRIEGRSASTDKFFSMSDFRSPRPTISVECDVDKGTYYETVVADWEEKVQNLLRDLEYEKNLVGELRVRLKRYEGDVSSEVDDKLPRRLSAGVKCPQCVELQARLRDILEKNYESIPTSSSNPRLIEPLRGSITKSTEQNNFQENILKRADALQGRDRKLLDENNKLQDELKTLTSHVEKLEFEKNDLLDQLEESRSQNKGPSIEELNDVKQELDKAKNAEAEARAALEVANYEVASKRRILQALKNAADAERMAQSYQSHTAFGNKDEDRNVELGSCDFLVTRMNRIPEMESRIQMLTKDNLQLQEKRVHLEGKLTDAGAEVERLTKDLHHAESLQIKYYEERATMSEKIAQLQREISILLSPPKEGQGLKSQDKEKEEKGKKMTKFLRRSRRGSQASDTNSENEDRLRTLQAEKDNIEKEFLRNSQRVADAQRESVALKEKLVETERLLRAVKKEFKRKLEEAEEFSRAMEANHNEVEECLKNQIQELTDRLMEPSDFPPPQAMMEDIKKLQARNAELQKKCDDLTKKVFEADIQNESLQSSITSLQAELASVQAKYESESKLMKDIVTAAQGMVQNLKEGGQDYKMANTAVEQLSSIREEVNRFAGIISETEGRWQTVSKQNVQLIRELSRTREELFEEQKKSRKTTDELRGSITGLTEKARTATDLENQVKELKETELKQQGVISQLEKKIERVRKAHSKDVTEAMNRVKALEEALVNARLQIGSLGAELDKKKEELQDLLRKKEKDTLSPKRERRGSSSRSGRDSFSGALPGVAAPAIVPPKIVIGEDFDREQAWSISQIRMKIQNICVSSRKLSQTVKVLSGDGKVTKKAVEKIAAEKGNSETTLSELLIMLARADEEILDASDDLSAYIGNNTNSDVKWKTIEYALKSERDELFSRVQELESLLSQSNKRVTDLESEKIKVLKQAEAAAHVDVQTRFEESRDTRGDLQSRVKSLMEERGQSRARLEEQILVIANLEERVRKLDTEKMLALQETDTLRTELAKVKVEMEEIEALRRRRIEELEIEVSKSSSSLARDESKLIRAERELAAARGESKVLTTKVSDLNAELVRSRERYKELCKSQGELERAASAMKLELQAKESALRESEQRQKKLEGQVEKTESELRSAEDERRNLQTRVKDLEILVDSMKKSENNNTKTSSEIAVVESALRAERESLKIAREQLQSKEREYRELDQRFNLLESRDRELVDRLQSQLNQFQEERSLLIKEATESKLKVVSLESERNTEADKRKKVEQDLSSLLEQLNATKDKLSKLEESEEALKRHINGLELKKSFVEAERTRVEAQLETSMSMASSLQNRVTELERLQTSIQDANGSLLRTNGELKDSILYLENTLQTNAESSQKRLRDLESRLELSLSECRKLQLHLEESNKQAEELRSAINHDARTKGVEVQELTKALLDSRQKAAALENKLTEKVEGLKLSERATQTLRQEVENLKRLQEIAEEAKTSALEELKSMREEHASLKRFHEESNSGLNSTITKLKSELDEAEKRCHLLDEELAKTKSRLASSEACFLSRQTEIQNLNDELTSTLSEKSNLIEMLNLKITEYDREILKLREDAIKSVGEHEKLKAVNTAEIEALKSKLAAMDDKLKDRNSAYDRLKEKTSHEIQMLTLKASSLQERLSSNGSGKEVEIVEMRLAYERQISSIKSELSTRNDEVSILEKRIKELRETYEKQISTKSTEIKKLSDDVRLLESKGNDMVAEKERNLQADLASLTADRDSLRVELDIALSKERELLTSLSDAKHKLSKMKQNLASAAEAEGNPPKEVQILSAEVASLKDRNVSIIALTNFMLLLILLAYLLR
ncbi:hypothetical protein HDU96_003658 [Phlyctochytrium bullatum]|nr:hypothetical protein HDU96_003658 [Phlyctochytrium bullatum]